MGVLFLFLLINLQTQAIAVEITQPRPVKFVYIHGANLNTEKAKEIYEKKDVPELHEEMKKALEESPSFQTHTLENGKYYIDPEPYAFFWGFESKHEIGFVQKQLSVMGKIRARITNPIRNILGDVLHDAVWVERPGNKTIISQHLYNAVQSESVSQEPIVYWGHSAGSLVIFNYMLYRAPYIDVIALGKQIHVEPSALQYLENQHPKPTCLQALLNSQSVRFDTEGKLVPFFKDIEGSLRSELDRIQEPYLKEKLGRMDELTNQTCLAPGSVKGFVTFGSPLAVFESELGNKDSSENYLTGMMLKYMIENGIFWLNINHHDDPIGFSLETDHLEDHLVQRFGLNLNRKTGFIYNEDKLTRGGGLLFKAHIWYWKKPKQFSVATRNAYETGYKQEATPENATAAKRYLEDTYTSITLDR